MRISAIGTSATCAVDLVAGDLPARPEGDHGERGERGEGGDERRDDVEQVDCAEPGRSSPCGSASQVGDRLQEPERAGAVRAVAELHPPDHLALEPASVYAKPPSTRLMIDEPP